MHFLSHHTLTSHSSLHNLRLQSSSACTASACLKAQHVMSRNVRLMLYEVLAAMCNDRSCIKINGNGCGLIDRQEERERERESAMVIHTYVNCVHGQQWALTMSRTKLNGVNEISVN